MNETKSEGLLLQTIPYLGTGRILKIFTRESGLISLFTKKKNLGSLGSPFCIGEWIYKKGSTDLHPLKDASLIHPLLELRTSFHLLSTAGSIAQDILKSQLPITSPHHLYELLISYFKKLPQFKHPEILLISFRLKLLIHEGLLSLNAQCTRCPENAQHLLHGESFCIHHALGRGIEFSQTAWQQLHLLAFASKFSSLEHLSIESSLIEKSSLLLDSIIHR